MQYLRVMVTEMHRLMGPVPEEEYDVLCPAQDGLVDLSAEMCCVLARYAPAGRPLWASSRRPPRRRTRRCSRGRP